MKTTEPGASTKWREWSCRTGNAGRWGQDARWHTLIDCLIDWTPLTILLRYMLTSIAFFFVSAWIWVLVCLRSTKTWASQIFLCRWPPLTPRGKDWSLRKTKRYVSLTASLTHLPVYRVKQLLLHLFPSVAEEDAGGAGEDSGADAARPERWLLILP